MLFFYAVIINDYYHNNITRPNIENFRAISKPFCISTANFTLIGELVKHIFNDLPPDPYKTWKYYNSYCILDKPDWNTYSVL